MIKHENYKFRIHEFVDTPFFKSTFSYCFGDYLRKERKDIDKSRFDR